MNILTFGTFDLFHIGHLNVLKYCRKHGNVYVGVSSDNFNYVKKNKYPTINENDRCEIIKNIKGVKKVFIEESYDKKKEYCKRYNADILIMGNDHEGKFDYLEDEIKGLKVVYIPRTKNISSTMIKDKISKL